jgi:D-alanyl-D-alanine carboxypeptidase
MEASLQPGAGERHLPSPEFERIEQLLSGLPTMLMTGAQVRVSERSGTWQLHAGAGDLRTRERYPTNAHFRIGNVTQLFTATAILQLAEAGILDLDTPLQRLLPRLLPAGYPPITARQLLHHTSGLPSYEQVFPIHEVTWFAAEHLRGWSPDELIRFATVHPVSFPPGTQQSYSATGYVALALLIERLTGEPYDRALARQLFEPLSLAQTLAPGSTTTLPPPHPRGYWCMMLRHVEELVDFTELNPSLFFGWGDLVSTSADLDTFLQALLAGALLPRSTVEQMLTPPDLPRPPGMPAYGMGPLVWPLPTGAALYGQRGALPGFATAAFALPDGSRRTVLALNPTDFDGDTQVPEEMSALLEAIYQAEPTPTVH